MDGEGGGTVTRAALRGRGHLGGAGRYIEMDRMDRIRLMEEGARSLQRNHAEHLGGAIETEDADRAHARLKRMAAFDSHNYDPTDNDLEEQALRARKRSSYHAEEKWKWGMSVIIGITMGFIAFVVDGLIDKLNAFKFGSTTGLIASRVAAFPTWLTFVSIAALYSFVAGGMVSYVAPLAAGSGIPELKTYLNGVHLKGLLRLRTIVAKLGGIAFSIGSGLIAGKEGPFVHGGGLVGGGLSAFGSHSLGFKTRKPSHFRDDASKRDFVAIGTATGVAVAFGAPIGGVLFTVEEGSSFYSSGMLWRGFLATCMGVLTTHWLMQIDFDALDFARARFGTHRDFGLYTDDEANYSRVFWWYFWEVPVFALMGALGGLLGALFVKINVKITTLRQRWIPVGKRERRHVEVVAVCVVTATIMFALTRWSPCADVPLPLRSDLPPRMTRPSFDGAHDAAIEFEYDAKSKDQIRELFFRRLYCPEGQYSRYGQLFFTPLSKSLKLLVHLGELGEGGDGNQFYFGMDALALYFCLMYGLMTWTYGIGAPTGLFVPSLAVGAAMGQIVGRAVAAVVGAIDPHLPVDLHTYAVLGAAASLGGATRMTISITVLVMETTGSLQLIIPLMLTVFFAKAVGDKYSLGIYDTHIKIRGAPYMLEHDLVGPAMDKLRVSEVMADGLVTLEPTCRVRDAVDVLTNTTHGAFPVSETPPRSPGEPIEMLGTITRGALLKILTNRVGFRDARDPSGPPCGNPAERDELLEKLKQIPFKALPIEEVVTTLSREDMNLVIDLAPLMQRHPFIVHADARLGRAYRLFRTMGLRHMYVTTSKPQIVGVVTRKDLVEESAALTLGEKAAEFAAELEDQAEDRKAIAGNPYDLPFVPYYTGNEDVVSGGAFSDMAGEKVERRRVARVGGGEGSGRVSPGLEDDFRR